MIKKVTLVVMALLVISVYAWGQAVQKSDSIIKYEKAKYLKEDLNKFLSARTKYPFDEMSRNIGGDVVFSIVINKDGMIGNMELQSLPNISLVNSAKAAINSLDGEWKPALIDNNPAEKEYLIVFRFRPFLDSRPVDYKSQANKQFKKQKYEKALAIYNDGIKDNNYDYELYEFRSKVKEALGDTIGAKEDLFVSNNLKNEIMSIVDIQGTIVRKVGVITTTKTVIVAVPSNR